jgi:hypothetical protein
MKRLIAFFVTGVFFFLAFSVAAEDHEWKPWHKYGIEYDYFMEELDRVLSEKGDVELGSLTVRELNDIASDFSISLQMSEFVATSKRASFFFPGAGQFKNNEIGLGVFFLSADIAVWSGTLIIAYLLLPSDLQFNQLDYFSSDYSSIRGAWGNHSFVEYLPAMGVAAGGIVLSTIIRIISSGHAEEIARKNVESGKITFEPLPFLLHIPSGSGRNRGKNW